jgi:hypothetical protein
MCSRLTFAGARVQTTIQDDELDFSLFICYKIAVVFLRRSRVLVAAFGAFGAFGRTSYPWG